jgi:hypothetical protein
MIHLSGVSGLLPSVDGRFLAAMRGPGGIDADIETFDWAAYNPGLSALLNEPMNRKQAAELATRLETIWRDQPGRRIVVTSHSGGTAIITWALEAARGDGMVDEIVMLAPALSPGYDLSTALRRVRGRVWVFWSPGDPALGQMTRMFGTIDRVQSEAAGRVGFRRPAGADAAQYAKVMSVPYDPAWQRDDNFGDHVGPMSAGFARGMIAPLLEGRRAPTTRPIEGPAPAP